MKISILLPYKENFSKNNTGAVSIFVNDVNIISKYKNNIDIYGSTIFKPLSNNYKNLHFTTKLFESSSKNYIKEFLRKIKDQQIDILEIHNRPHYLNYLDNTDQMKKILFFHNNPLDMQGSVSTKERMNLYNKANLIIFNSNWTKSKFLKNLSINKNENKLRIIPQSTSKVKINFAKKKK